MPKYRKINDLWNAYEYGDKIKVVYIKAATRREKSGDTLFPEFEGMTEQEKRWFMGKSNSFFLEHLGDNCEKKPSEKTTDKNEDTDERLAASISRTKSRIYELALCNEFKFFCTFTQDETKVKNRFDLDTFQKDFSHYIRNLNRNRADKIRYLLIPERHQNGAWHLHGFLSGLVVGEDLREFTLEEHIPYRLRNMIAKGEKVYNWEKYSKKYGYFTATDIKNKDAASAYICKYVTKEVIKQGREMGRHLFFASQGLNSRKPLIKNSTDQSGEFVRCPYSDDEWDFENDYVKVKWIDNISVQKNGQ